jgi:hypothetical protein
MSMISHEVLRNSATCLRAEILNDDPPSPATYLAPSSADGYSSDWQKYQFGKGQLERKSGRRANSAKLLKEKDSHIILVP